MRTEIDFAGVLFRNPLIVASCPLTGTVSKLKALEEAGAAGFSIPIVERERAPLDMHMRAYRVGDRWGVFNAPGLNLSEAIDLVNCAKKEVKGRIIANIKGDLDDPDGWVELAQAMEKAGADMLELNNLGPLYYPPFELMYPERYDPDLERNGRNVKAVVESVDIPVICKMNMHVPDIVSLGKVCAASGADGLTTTGVLSGPVGVDIYHGGKGLFPGAKNNGVAAQMGPWIKPLSMRCLLALSMSVDLPLAGCGGIMTWEDAIERMMLGATVIQLCTTIYWNGMKAITRCLEGMEKFKQEYGYDGFQEIVGLGKQHCVSPSQFLDEVKDLLAEIDEDKCTGCGLCVEGLGDCFALHMENGVAQVDAAQCYGCALCQYFCPSEAISMRERPADTPLPGFWEYGPKED